MNVEKFKKMEKVEFKKGKVRVKLGGKWRSKKKGKRKVRFVMIKESGSRSLIMEVSFKRNVKDIWSLTKNVSGCEVRSMKCRVLNLKIISEKEKS